MHVPIESSDIECLVALLDNANGCSKLHDGSLCCLISLFLNAPWSLAQERGLCLLLVQCHTFSVTIAYILIQSRMLLHISQIPLEEGLVET